jgi:hypothetical protein
LQCQSLSFIDFAAEIRDRIYPLSLPAVEPLPDVYPSRTPRTRTSIRFSSIVDSHGLLLSNKQIMNEMLNIHGDGDIALILSIGDLKLLVNHIYLAYPLRNAGSKLCLKSDETHEGRLDLEFSTASKLLFGMFTRLEMVEEYVFRRIPVFEPWIRSQGSAAYSPAPFWVPSKLEGDVAAQIFGTDADDESFHGIRQIVERLSAENASWSAPRMNSRFWYPADVEVEELGGKRWIKSNLEFVVDWMTGSALWDASGRYEEISTPWWARGISC